MERMLRGWFSLREEEVENNMRTSKIRMVSENKKEDKYISVSPSKNKKSKVQGYSISHFDREKSGSPSSKIVEKLNFEKRFETRKKSKTLISNKEL